MSQEMTPAQFDALPPAPGRHRELLGGTLWNFRAVGPDRRDRATTARLTEFFEAAGATVRAEWPFRDDANVFTPTLAVWPAGTADEPLPRLAVLLNPPSERWDGPRVKAKALIDAGVPVVWEEDYFAPFRVHRPEPEESGRTRRSDDPIDAGDGLPVLRPAEVLADLPERGEQLPAGVEEVWTDHLREKHECGPSKHCLPVPLTVPDGNGGGREVNLWVIDYLTDFDEVVVTAARGDLLFAIARWQYPGGGYGDEHGDVPVLLVARKHDETNYLVHVWHELYDWSFKYLGLEKPSADGGTP